MTTAPVEAPPHFPRRLFILVAVGALALCAAVSAVLGAGQLDDWPPSEPVLGLSHALTEPAIRALQGLALFLPLAWGWSGRLAARGWEQGSRRLTAVVPLAIWLATLVPWFAAEGITQTPVAAEDAFASVESIRTEVEHGWVRLYRATLASDIGTTMALFFALLISAEAIRPDAKPPR